jgi:fumarate hydratase subunit beta
VTRGADLPIRLSTPLSLWDVESLHAGDRVVLSGVVYTARDAAHARLTALLAEGRPLPFPLEGQVIYYVGPTRRARASRSARPAPRRAGGWTRSRPPSSPRACGG